VCGEYEATHEDTHGRYGVAQCGGRAFGLRCMVGTGALPDGSPQGRSGRPTRTVGNGNNAKRVAGKTARLFAGGCKMQDAGQDRKLKNTRGRGLDSGTISSTW
jgi:hypothetical protein